MLNRDKRGRFTKGKSGNPHGRPKIPTDVRTMLKEATVPATKLLIETIGNKDVQMSIRIDAAKEILNRVYGKPTQPLDADVDTTIRIMLEGELKDYAE